MNTNISVARNAKYGHCHIVYDIMTVTASMSMSESESFRFVHVTAVFTT